MNFSSARVLAAVWALVFAAVHVIWAGGATFGLGASAGATMTGWFLYYDVLWRWAAWSASRWRCGVDAGC